MTSFYESRSPAVRRLLLLAPGLAAFAVLFVIPVVQLLAEAFVRDGSFTLDRFAMIFTSDNYMGVIWRTLWIATVSTVVTVVAGYGLGYYIVFRAKRKRLLVLLLFVSMLVDLVVRIFGWMVFFAREGIFSTVLQWVGVLNEPYSLLFTKTIIVIGIVQFCLPLMAMVLVGVLSGLDRSLQEAARNLGASRFETFRRVTLPLSLDGVIAGGSLSFALSVSAFVMPQLLGGAQNRMLANSVYSVVTTTGDTALAAALSIVLVVGAIGLLATVESGTRVGGA